MNGKTLGKEIAIRNFADLLRTSGNDDSVEEQKENLTRVLRLMAPLMSPNFSLRIEVLDDHHEEWVPDDFVRFADNLNGYHGLVMRSHGWYWLYSPRWRITTATLEDIITILSETRVVQA